MKLRADVVSVYKDVHSWVGVCAGLFLFVAFYAGAISVFEQPLARWLSPAPLLPEPVSLARAPDLMEKVFAAHPEARDGYTIVVTPDRARPARLLWQAGGGGSGHGGGHGHGRHGSQMAAALDAQGHLVTVTPRASATARFIDILHQQMGLPLPHETAMLVMGVIAAAYAIALVSGTIAYLPALKRTLFAVRLEAGKRRAWLDLHNLFGFMSLPFHLVMAVTSVVFAFHEPIYAVQHRLLAPSGPVHGHDKGPGRPAETFLPPVEIVARLATAAPGFVPDTLEYSHRGPHGPFMLRVAGHDSRYGMRGPVAGFAVVDPVTGRILSSDYLPGHQTAGFAVLTAFFALHFGSFGGLPVRWGYLVLGLAGAFVFYTGNQLWIRARRRREGRGPDVVLADTRATAFLARLTTGCTLGCMAGIAVILLASGVMPGTVSFGQVEMLFYAVLLLCLMVAFGLPARIGGAVLLGVSSLGYLALAIVALRDGWLASGTTPGEVDAPVCVGLVALAIGVSLAVALWRLPHRRTRSPVLSAARS